MSKKDRIRISIYVTFFCIVVIIFLPRVIRYYRFDNEIIRYVNKNYGDRILPDGKIDSSFVFTLSSVTHFEWDKVYINYAVFGEDIDKEVGFKTGLNPDNLAMDFDELGFYFFNGKKIVRYRKISTESGILNMYLGKSYLPRDSARFYISNDGHGVDLQYIHLASRRKQFKTK